MGSENRPKPIFLILFSEARRFTVFLLEHCQRCVLTVQTTCGNSDIFKVVVHNLTPYMVNGNYDFWLVLGRKQNGDSGGDNRSVRFYGTGVIPPKTTNRTRVNKVVRRVSDRIFRTLAFRNRQFLSEMNTEDSRISLLRLSHRRGFRLF